LRERLDSLYLRDCVKAQPLILNKYFPPFLIIQLFRCQRRFVGNVERLHDGRFGLKACRYRFQITRMFEEIKPTVQHGFLIVAHQSWQTVGYAVRTEPGERYAQRSILRNCAIPPYADISFGAAAVSGYSNTGVVSAGSLVNQVFTAPFSGAFATQVFTPFAFQFTATKPTTMIQFTATGPNNQYGPVIDSVSVAPLSSVPEPSSIALLPCWVVVCSA